jgi:phenylacetate-coenzyme A ligase PaaK-like adenylate-forming protein
MFTLDEILLRASTHPMYAHLLGDNRDNQEGRKLRLEDFPTVDKTHLIAGFAKLMETDPTSLHAAYLSPTGGTRWGSKQLHFISDTRENRLQRVAFVERVLAPLGVFTATDIVVNVHGATAPMYRSQELIGTLIEYAGATELGVGGFATNEEVLYHTELFRANVFTGTASKLLQIAEYMAAHPELFPKVANVTKVVYTSEHMTRPQELFLRRVLKNVEVVSCIYGSSEGGPWAAGTPQREVRPENREWDEMAFDSEMMVVQIMDPESETVLADSRVVCAGGADAASEDCGPVGEIVLTSLSRARNPLLRYRTGDLGSLRRYNSSSSLCCLRFKGRSPEKSFDLDGDYMDVAEFEQRVFSKKEYRVIEWQVIVNGIGAAEGRHRLEFRVVTEGNDEKCHEWEEKVKTDLVGNVIGPEIDVVVLKVGYDQLERGRVARKVVKVLDRRAGRVTAQ